MEQGAFAAKIGAVGAMLFYPNETIQHAGVYLDGYVADHFYLGRPRGVAGDMNRARLAQNLSAVTAACLVVRKTIWEQVGGLDEGELAVALNDVDFCLKVRKQESFCSRVFGTSRLQRQEASLPTYLLYSF